jgi:Na+/H+ antiporter NhaD/arsenite permease-like protein
MKHSLATTIAVALAILCLSSGQLFAAEEAELPGSAMSLLWVVPFIGLLLSIATGPLIYAHVWERHYGKIAAAWSALVIAAMVLSFGVTVSLQAVLHTLLLEYRPFIILLFALFTISGGILFAGNIHGTPAVNAGLLLSGALLASVVGTTGASMILIRPIIRANDNRPFNAHVVVFFIFLVSNIGGALTPLGDPPLFIGFLLGVDFFWPTTHLWPATFFVVGIVLAVFLALDWYLHVREKGLPKIKDPTPDSGSQLRISGLVNFLLLGGVIAAILVSASWNMGVALHIAGVEVDLQNLIRDVVILALALASLTRAGKARRIANGFSWAPIVEVAKLFAAIFVCIVPAIAMLRAGLDGAFAPLMSMVMTPAGTPNDTAFFWLTGILSSFLDNAPTYLVFFQLAGGDAKALMTSLASTLAAISLGAVFMGANTYIGNAPNFMVYSIARGRGVRMPSFFAYMLWSGAVLIPTFLLTGYIFLE